VESSAAWASPLRRRAKAVYARGQVFEEAVHRTIDLAVARPVVETNDRGGGQALRSDSGEEYEQAPTTI